MGHSAPLTFDPNGRRLAAVFAPDGSDVSVISWDLDDGATERKKLALGKSVSWASFVPGGRSLAIDQNSKTKILDPWTGKLRSTLVNGQAGAVRVFSRSTVSYRALNSPSRIQVWELESGREAARYEVPGQIVGLAFSSKNTYLAYLDDAGRITVLDRARGRKQVLGSGSGDRKVDLAKLQFSADESLLAVGMTTQPGVGHPVEVWDVACGKRLQVSAPGEIQPAISHFCRMGARWFSPQARLRGSGGSTHPRPPSRLPAMLTSPGPRRFLRTARFWLPVVTIPTSARRSSCGIRIPADFWLVGRAAPATVAALAFSPDGKILASSSLDSGKHNLIVWDPKTHEPLMNLDGHTDRVRSISISPDSHWLASASDDLTRGCGTWPPGRPGPCSLVIPRISPRSPSARTGGNWLRHPTTRPSESGMSSPARLGSSSTTSTTSWRSRSLPTALCWPRSTRKG